MANSPTLAEAKHAAVELEDLVRRAISDYEKEYGVCIDSITLLHSKTIGDVLPRTVSVAAKVLIRP